MKKKVSAIFETAAVKPTPSEPREPTGWFKSQLGFLREFAERRLRACATRRLRLLPEEWGAFAESERYAVTTILPTWAFDSMYR